MSDSVVPAAASDRSRDDIKPNLKDDDRIPINHTAAVGRCYSGMQARVNDILFIEDVGRDPNGIDCIEESGRYILWNPATGKFQITPISPFAYESPCLELLIVFHGFGYDQIRDDYKVIRLVMFFFFEIEKDAKDPLWEIYWIKRNS
ncbi:unnamed protein product [Vicia faba]|uniref:Uncharacterized protein n=1 Tax=Vicia faba TaxID=3906 RepID=A0AAV0YMK8_VICFA|nr:unnamed protein product [Vicia faba]